MISWDFKGADNMEYKEILTGLMIEKPVGDGLCWIFPARLLRIFV